MMRFGAFEFDPVARRLRRDGLDVHLPPKAFELLGVLLEAAPAVVSKRVLHARLWPGGVVADATLVALVKQLRRALREPERATTAIRTVHRIGYALDTSAPRAGRPVPGTQDRWLVAGQRRLPLATGENLVGRDPAAQVRLDHATVSRRHSRIVVDARGARIDDLGSKNGTFLDGKRLASGPAELRDGVRILFGSVEVTYRESGGGMPTVTHFGNP
jgi:DNA-binding winged helix-turn-helix (wHTH) protein